MQEIYFEQTAQKETSSWNHMGGGRGFIFYFGLTFIRYPIHWCEGLEGKESFGRKKLKAKRSVRGCFFLRKRKGKGLANSQYSLLETSGGGFSVREIYFEETAKKETSFILKSYLHSL